MFILSLATRGAVLECIFFFYSTIMASFLFQVRCGASDCRVLLSNLLKLEIANGYSEF